MPNEAVAPRENADGIIVTPWANEEHGDHKLYRCDDCKSILTHRETNQERDGCRWCGSMKVKYASWVTDAEFAYAVKNGFNPLPDAWQYKPGNPGE